MLTVVAAALVDDEGRILVQRRPEGVASAGLWEFPGGKIEPGETPEAALVRELSEELGIMVDPASLAPACFASEPLGDRHLVLLVYLCRRWQRRPRPLQATALQWVRPAELHALDMPTPDRPLIATLERLVREGSG